MRARLSIMVVLLACAGAAFAQQKSGTIRVRKSNNLNGLYRLEEGAYYAVKLYVRLFDNNAAVFLRAPVSPEKARDSTARLLYTYRKSPAVYRIINDSVYIEGRENDVPFIYRGVVRKGELNVQKVSQSKKMRCVFKKVL